MGKTKPAKEILITTTEVLAPVVDMGILTKTHISGRKIVDQREDGQFIEIVDDQKSTYRLHISEYNLLK